VSPRILVEALLNLGGAADTFPRWQRERIQRKIADRLCEVLSGDLPADEMLLLALAVHREEVLARHREAFRKDPAGVLAKLGVVLDDSASQRGAA
jgi:hypothetical protein